MKKILPLSALLTVALLVLAACQTASTVSTDNTNNAKNTTNAAAPKTDGHGHTDDAPRIQLADAKKEFDANNALFVDTRAKETYYAEHIKGAINVPVNELETKISRLKTDKKIIVYCS